MKNFCYFFYITIQLILVFESLQISLHSEIKPSNLKKEHLSSDNQEQNITFNFYQQNEENLIKRLQNKDINYLKNKSPPEIFINNEICNVLNKTKDFAQQSLELSYNGNEYTEILLLKDNKLDLKNYICKACLDPSVQISLLEKTIKSLKNELDLLNSDEELTSFVETINKLNLFKLDFEKTNDFVKTMKRYKCDRLDQLESELMEIESSFTQLLSYLQKIIAIEQKEKTDGINIVILN